MWTEHQILASSSGSLQERLDSLACAYREQLPEKIRQIDALWQPLAGGALDDSALKAIYVMAHNMCGSADTFRLPQLTEEARLLDRALQEVVEGKSQLTPKVRAHIGELVAALKAVVGKLTE
ncbi:MAG: Hpt domain-containing protein [Gammaproteobacteria bacterium]|nr:Hpt domain-containing protein [Gammaproteobacteria bacterium]